MAKHRLLKHYCEFYLDGCTGDEIRSIANGETDEELLKDFKPEPDERELALRYLRLGARYILQHYDINTFK